MTIHMTVCHWLQITLDIIDSTNQTRCLVADIVVVVVTAPMWRRQVSVATNLRLCMLRPSPEGGCMPLKDIWHKTMSSNAASKTEHSATASIISLAYELRVAVWVSSSKKLPV
jgi:hypothetical protein